MSIELNRIAGHVKRLLPPEAKDARVLLDAVLAHPETQAVLAGVERDRLAHRKALVAHLAALPGAIKAQQDAAYETERSAHKRLKLAEAEFAAATAAAVEAARAAGALSGTLTRELGETQRALVEGADTRLAEFIAVLEDLFQGAHNTLDWSITVDAHFESSGRSITTATHNGADVLRAVQLIREHQATCRAMQLQAQPESATTERLRAMSLDLSALLAPLSWRDFVGIDDSGAVIRQSVHRRAATLAPIPRPAGRAAQQPGA